MKNSAKARSVSAFALDQPANGCPHDREAPGHPPRQLAANENLLAWRARFPAARVRDYEYKLGQYAFPTPLTPLPKRFPGRNSGSGPRGSPHIIGISREDVRRIALSAEQVSQRE